MGLFFGGMENTFWWRNRFAVDKVSARQMAFSTCSSIWCLDRNVCWLLWRRIDWNSFIRKGRTISLGYSNEFPTWSKSRNFTFLNASKEVLKFLQIKFWWLSSLEPPKSHRNLQFSSPLSLSCFQQKVKLQSKSFFINVLPRLYIPLHFLFRFINWHQTLSQALAPRRRLQTISLIIETPVPTQHRPPLSRNHILRPARAFQVNKLLNHSRLQKAFSRGARLHQPEASEFQ